MGRLEFDSKEDYLKAFRTELEARGELALSASAIRRALDDADERFDILLGRGRTPTAVAEALGRPSERAEVVIATRLLRLRPGSDTGPGLVTYLRVIRALAIAAPVNLLMTLLPPFVLLTAIAAALGACAFVFAIGTQAAVSFFSAAASRTFVEITAVGFQLLGSLAGVVFVTTCVLFVLRGAMIVVWRWAKWNVGFLFEENT